MKSLRHCLCLFIFSSSACLSAEWDVILLSGETHLDCRIMELRNDSVLVQAKEWSEWFWLGNIWRIERRGTAWGIGAVVGGVLGFAGGAWYVVEHPAATFDQPPVLRGFMGGVIGVVPGALAGALLGSMIDTSVSYDFTRMGFDERLAAVRKMILDE
jgi:hypothetical protein